MFEFDVAKSEANRVKHGIDFVDAQALWQDERLIEIGTIDYGREERRLFVGRIGDRCWTAVVTFRHGRIRIISVRRSRHREQAAYRG